MDEVKLLPCAWCGKVPSIVCPDNSYGSALITCGDANECPVDVTAWADLSRGETLETAIAAWNARAIEATRPTIPNGVDKVRHHLSKARHIMYDEHWLSKAIDTFLIHDSDGAATRRAHD